MIMFKVKKTINLIVGFREIWEGYIGFFVQVYREISMNESPFLTEILKKCLQEINILCSRTSQTLNENLKFPPRNLLSIICIYLYYPVWFVTSLNSRELLKFSTKIFKFPPRNLYQFEVLYMYFFTFDGCNDPLVNQNNISI